MRLDKLCILGSKLVGAGGRGGPPGNLLLKILLHSRNMIIKNLFTLGYPFGLAANLKASPLPPAPCWLLAAGWLDACGFSLSLCPFGVWEITFSRFWRAILGTICFRIGPHSEICWRWVVTLGGLQSEFCEALGDPRFYWKLLGLGLGTDGFIRRCL